MKSQTIPILVALVFLVPGCGDSNVHSLRPDPLPQNVQEDCPPAAQFLRRGGTIADAELMILNMGAALNECGAEKQIAVGAYDGLRKVLKGE